MPDYIYRLPPIDSGYNYNHFAPLGDINGDGYSDIGVIISPRLFWEKKLLVYFGSEIGIQLLPNQVLDVNIPTRSSGFVNGIGDVNGDGFDDVFFSEVIYFGTDTGLNHTYGWRAYKPTNIQEPPGYAYYLDGKGFPVGDVNNDGYDDFVLTSQRRGYYHLFNGGKKVPANAVNIYSADAYEDLFYEMSAFSAGDINGDGYKEVVFDAQDLYIQVTIRYGNENNLEYTPFWKHNSLQLKAIDRSVTTADVNGDGYSDILMYMIDDYYRESLVTIYGSASGPDINNPDSVINRISYISVGELYLQSVGDINEDGYEDIFIHFSEEDKLPAVIYGSSNGLKVSEPDYNYSNYTNFKPVGDINGDGKTDFSATTLNSSFFTLVYSRPTSNETPVTIHCEPLYNFCYDSTNNYIIPDLAIMGNYSKVEYKITGRTRRTGSGTSASGYFRHGESEIIWTVTDNNNQLTSCTTRITISPPFEIKIKPGISVFGGQPNHIYIGYGHAGFRLAALSSGGSGPYSYNWSNGVTERYNSVRHTVEGIYPYRVRVYNKYNCVALAQTAIIVKDIRCISSIEENINNNLPWLMADPLVKALLKSKIHIQICQNGQTICIDRDSAYYLINTGSSPGKCASEMNAVSVLREKQFGESEVAKLTAYPNPSSSSFKINLSRGKDERQHVYILDISGKKLESYINIQGSTIEVGKDLKPGIYLAEIYTGTERRVVKLIKIK